MLTDEFVTPRRRLAEPILGGFDATKIVGSVPAAHREADRTSAADLTPQGSSGVLPVFRHSVMGLAVWDGNIIER